MLAARAPGPAANVVVEGYRTLRDGQVSALVGGDVGAVTAAAAARVGELCAKRVIPRPAGGTEGVVSGAATPPA